VAVDVENGGAVILGVDDVVVPDLVVERARHGPDSKRLFGSSILGRRQR
jgi:hypothetical protein